MDTPDQKTMADLSRVFALQRQRVLGKPQEVAHQEPQFPFLHVLPPDALDHRPTVAPRIGAGQRPRLHRLMVALDRSGDIPGPGLDARLLDLRPIGGNTRPDTFQRLFVLLVRHPSMCGAKRVDALEEFRRCANLFLVVAFRRHRIDGPGIGTGLSPRQPSLAFRETPDFPA